MPIRWLSRGAALLAGIIVWLGVAGLPRAQAQSLLDFTPAERRAIASHGPWPPPAAHDPGNARPGGARPSRSASGCSSSRACRPTAGCRARAAIDPNWPLPTASRVRSAARCSTATRRRCGTRCTSAGTAGTARPTACGRKRSGRSSTRARWRPVPRICDARSPPTPNSTAATGGCSAAPRPAMTTRRCWWTRPRRSAPLSARWCRAARRSTTFATRWRAAMRRPRHATRSTRSAACASSSARAAATCATWARCSPTASSPTPGCRSSCGPAWWTRGATTASSRCARAATTCFGLQRCARPARGNQDAPRGSAAPQLRRVQGAQPAQRGRHRALHARRQLATLDDVVRHYSELNLDRLHADGEQILRPLKLSDAERADLVAFLRTLSDPRARAWRLDVDRSICSASKAER